MANLHGLAKLLDILESLQDGPPLVISRGIRELNGNLCGC